jgi:PhnB protein
MAIRGGRPIEQRIAPHLLVHDGSLAVEFYKGVFDATELYRSDMPGGAGVHAQLRLAESTILVTQATAPSGAAPDPPPGSSVILELYVDDVDAVYQRAIEAGATSACPLMDTFFGDRYGQVRDPFGHVWGLATVKEELTPKEVAERMAGHGQAD